MKKNKTMRLAAMLLVLVLMTTCVIGGTFAKYTTQDSAYDEARVAKWGVELAVVGNLYGETYGAENKIIKDDATDATVQSLSAADDVVAPGTQNEEGMTFTLTGKPEVSGTVTATLVYENIYLNAGTYGVMVKVPAGTVTAANFNEFGDLYTSSNGSYTEATVYSDTDYYTLEDVVTLGAIYYPVEYALLGDNTANNTSYNANYTDGIDYLSVDTLEEVSETIGARFGDAGEKNLVDGKTTVTYSGTTFIPNEDLEEVVKLGDQKITWKWDFCQTGTGEGECEDGDSACAFCKADTILGLLHGNTDASLNGEVVKLNDGTYVAPEAAADGDLNDYNLESYFELDITVTQTD